ncbi:hypothetical protein Salat_2442800 [Sesamum alatum]|uniref:Uncharacterized protein n=1 Tax=Sesamum alatum TaxID=300844 RepID=A0AAE1XZ48_9LAMI|nr:hypothetical protein Salat_2442800 [Sesamum alatum]
MDRKGVWCSLFPGWAGGEGHNPPSKEEGNKVLSSLSTSFPRPWKSRPAQRITLAFGALLSNHKEKGNTNQSPTEVKLRLLFFRTQGSLLDPFLSLPHCSSNCVTPYVDFLLFCPLSIHMVLKAEEERWAAGTTSPLSHTSIQKQV